MTDSILSSYQAYTHTSIVPFEVAPPVVDHATLLLDGETDGFAIDATNYDDYTAAAYLGGPVGGTVSVISTGDPTDNLTDVAINSSNIAQSGTSPKTVNWSSTPFVRWSPHNYVLQSQALNTTWSLSNVSVTADAIDAPDGTTTADKLKGDTTTFNHNVTQSITVLSGFVYTASVYAKSGELNWFVLSPDEGGGSQASYFDTTNGVIGNAGGSPIARTITDAGNGWWRCTVTYTAGSATGTYRIYLANANGGAFYTGANTTDGMYFWGVQANRGYTVLPYMATTTATKFGIAQSYDSARSKFGIYTEPAATNLALYSDDMTNAAWTKSNMSTAKTATGPEDAANTATTITATAGNATSLQAITSANNERITSVWIKRRTGTGNIDLTQNNGSTWTTQTVTSSWAKYNLSSTVSVDPTVGIRIVTSGDAVDIWGFQHEARANIGVTSTVPTLGATVTRAADLVTVAHSTYPFSTTANTAYTDCKKLQGADLLNLGTSSGGTQLIRSGDTGMYGGTLTGYGSGGGATANTRFQGTGAFNGTSGNNANSSQGGTVATNADTTAIVSNTPTGIGSYGNGPNVDGVIYTYRVVIVPRRVSDADLPNWRYEA